LIINYEEWKRKFDEAVTDARPAQLTKLVMYYPEHVAKYMEEVCV